MELDVSSGCAQSGIEDVLGYKVFCGAEQDCVNQIMQQVSGEGRCRWLACINPHSYAVALSDGQFSESLHHADWLIPDGSGIVLASRISRGDIRRRITGSDVFLALSSRMNVVSGFSVFFLGSTPECLADIRGKMELEFPGIRFAGSYSPPFKPEYSESEIDAMIAAINLARPDVLWVGMTAPKQEKWLYQNLYRLDVRFAAAIGAVFDFYTGQVKRSHPMFQKLGLEWLPRLVQQPRRLWRRMFVSAPIFIWHVLKSEITSAWGRLRENGRIRH